MSRALPIVSLLVALGALGVALTATPPPAPAPVVPPPVAGLPLDEQLELQKRVELLEDEARMLGDRLLELERQPRAGGGDAGVDGALVQEVASLRDEVRRLRETQPGSPLDGGIAAREAQVRKRLANLYAVDTKKWRSFLSEMDLTGEQRQLLEERLAAEEKAQLTAFASDEPSVSGAVRTMMAEQRQTNQAMRQALGPELYERFRSAVRARGEAKAR